MFCSLKVKKNPLHEKIYRKADKNLALGALSCLHWHFVNVWLLTMDTGQSSSNLCCWFYIARNTVEFCATSISPQFSSLIFFKMLCICFSKIEDTCTLYYIFLFKAQKTLLNVHLKLSFWIINLKSNSARCSHVYNIAL